MQSKDGNTKAEPPRNRSCHFCQNFVFERNFNEELGFVPLPPLPVHWVWFVWEMLQKPPITTVVQCVCVCVCACTLRHVLRRAGLGDFCVFFAQTPARGVKHADCCRVVPASSCVCVCDANTVAGWVVYRGQYIRAGQSASERLLQVRFIATALGPLIMAMASLPPLYVHPCARVSACACRLAAAPTNPTHPTLHPTHVLIKVLQRGSR